ncbi:hypothetical protein L226DRAFT_565811 [Lentinus tigrinus ALCF2SS1-7]|uniref:Vacuolar ATPase assembly integral membrane protein VMA21 n=1 Tax=Lentinus tigrinus ALCF2SS1-6 TaxID=1328759 RepID=A0A5C2T4T5_9APHY|nr:hypothetical protein L227DRAFT_605473 [Lentinus tigrinus ALCF2SS1-6]RPD80999.1 hypothetical protein L226DRAFT_565811 [Lentinus tigrinus ALCF2SS1-7]
MSGQAAPGKLIAQQAEQQGGVLAKLVIFALALGFVPISSYFLSRDYLWAGNTIYAAITAIISANLVLVAYIIESVREESRLRAREKQQQPAESKKDR